MLTEEIMRLISANGGKGLFNLVPLSAERLPYWASLPLWNITDAVLLSCNTVLRTSSRGDLQYDHELNKLIFERQDVLSAHISAKTFPLVTMKDYDDYNIDVPEEFIPDACMVKPFEFIRWAGGIGWTLPQELCRAVAKVHECSNGASNMGTCSGMEAQQELIATSPKVDWQSGVCYNFIQTERGWSLQFGDVELRGVKDQVGLRFIKILLQNPGEKISVLKLQELIGDVGTEQEHEDCDYLDDDYDAGGSGVSAWEALDARAIQEYKAKLAMIEEALSIKTYDDETIDRLKKEKVAIEAQLREASYRHKDPEIEKNRKRILKNITDAIKAVRKLEELYNHNDRPLSSHLSRFIKTGASCSYTATGDDVPPWNF